MTLIRAEDLEFPNTMTDIDYDTWMLSGSAVMQDGQTVRNSYCCDLDTLSVGSRLGMMRHLDGSLHYTINGEDQGIACENIPPNVYAVIDLYGQCAQVSIVHNPPLPIAGNSMASSQVLESSHISLPALGSEVIHRFSSTSCGKGVDLKNNNQTAVRALGVSRAVVVGNNCLEGDDYFEIRIDEVDSKWSGSLRLGVTSNVNCDAVQSLEWLASLSGHQTYWIEDSEVKYNNRIFRTNYSTSLDRLTNGDKVGVRRSSEGCIRFSINGEDFGVAAASVPRKIIPLVELFGSTLSVTVTSVSHHHLGSPNIDFHHSRILGITSHLQDSLEVVPEQNEKEEPSAGNASRPQELPDQMAKPLEFHENHGRNVQLKNRNRSAIRTDSYNQGLSVTNRPLARDELFSVKIDGLNPTWSSSLIIGILTQSPDKIHFPVTAMGLKKNAFVICGDSVFQNGFKINGPYGPNLDNLKVNQTVGVLVDSLNQLHLYVNDVDQGIAAKNVPQTVYGIIDLYGQCEEVSMVVEDKTDKPSLEDQQMPEILDLKSVSDSATCCNDQGKLSISEKHLCNLSISESISVVRNCDYMNLCQRFRLSLALPAQYFTPDYPVCYCLSCYKVSL